MALKKVLNLLSHILIPDQFYNLQISFDVFVVKKDEIASCICNKN